jgi:hypothetical protein
MYPDWAGGKVLNYLGSNGYNFAQVMLLAEKRFGVVVMTNQGAGTTSNPVAQVVDRLLESRLYGKPL